MIFRPLSDLVGIRVRDCGRSDEALVDVDHEDARRLRDWLTTWLAEQDEESEADDEGVYDPPDLAPAEVRKRALVDLRDQAQHAAYYGERRCYDHARACMEVHDWLARMPVED